MFCHIVLDNNNIIRLMKINVQILSLGQNANVVDLVVTNVIKRSDLKNPKGWEFARLIF